MDFQHFMDSVSKSKPTTHAVFIYEYGNVRYKDFKVFESEEKAIKYAKERRDDNFYNEAVELNALGTLSDYKLIYSSKDEIPESVIPDVYKDNEETIVKKLTEADILSKGIAELKKIAKETAKQAADNANKEQYEVAAMVHKDSYLLSALAKSIESSDFGTARGLIDKMETEARESIPKELYNLLTGSDTPTEDTEGESEPVDEPEDVEVPDEETMEPEPDMGLEDEEEPEVEEPMDEEPMRESVVNEKKIELFIDGEYFATTDQSKNTKDAVKNLKAKALEKDDKDKFKNNKAGGIDYNKVRKALDDKKKITAAMKESVKKIQESDYQYKSDEDIADEFSGMKIVEIDAGPKRSDGTVSGKIVLEFPNAGDNVGGGTDEVVDYWIKYGFNNKISFENWYPDAVYNTLVDNIEKEIGSANEACDTKLKETDEEPAKKGGMKDTLDRWIANKKKTNKEA